MEAWLKCLVLGVLFFAGAAAAEVVSKPEVCQADRTHVRAELDDIRREYEASKKLQTVMNLVALDHRLRTLLSNRPNCYDGKDDTGLGKPTDAVIGVSLEHYSGMLWYSGKLLAEAHHMNPGSPQRSSTLYATVERVSPDGQYNSDPPDFKAARAYLREFPNGPFAAVAAMGLAMAYGNAYAALHMSAEQTAIADVADGVGCVAESLGDLGGKTNKQLLSYTKTKAEFYFRLAFRLRKPSDEVMASYQEWREGKTPMAFYCPD